MSLLLRKIKKGNWYRPESLVWLAAGELPADPLGDLVTKANRLSVWLVDDDRSDLGDVVAALAASRDFLDTFDYALFDDEILAQARIEFEPTPGITPDPRVNERHVDLIELTGAKLVQLAQGILANGMTARLLPKAVGQLVADAVNARCFPASSISEKIRDRIGPLLRA